MRITARQLRQIIAEEIQKSKNRTLAEGTSERPIRVTPQFINRIIKEELTLQRKQQRLAEARRRIRARRLAEAKRRRKNEPVYYY
tara:strand:+ start:2148 stop:2402 length:255 start_codon:yes stop_codon:yes gene_type:complete